MEAVIELNSLALVIEELSVRVESERVDLLSLRQHFHLNNHIVGVAQLEQGEDKGDEEVYLNAADNQSNYENEL